VTATATVTPTPTVPVSGEPGVSIVKSSNPLSYSADGQTIHYNYLVTNTGNVTLTNVKVSDDKASVSCPQATLGVGAYMNCTASYTTSLTDVSNTSITNHVSVTSNEIPTPVTDTLTIPYLATISTGTISGVIYIDANTDGMYQTGETLITQSIAIQLLDAEGNVVATTFTLNGSYSFTNVPAGSYTVVKFTNPSGYLPTSPDDVPVSVTAGETSEANFGHNKLTTGIFKLFGYVWNDVNENTLWESGEAPIPGITIRLYGANQMLLSSTVTNAQGYFEFTNLQAGIYAVVEQDGTEFPVSSTTNFKWVTLGGGGQAQVESQPDLLGSLIDRVFAWFDLNKAVSSTALVFGDYQVSGACTEFSDPAVDVSHGNFPAALNAGKPYFLQFQVTNNGTAAASSVEAYTEIPAILNVTAVNVYYRSMPGSSAAEDAYSVSLSGNSLIVHFDTLTPGNAYDVLISTLASAPLSAGSYTLQVNLRTTSPSCGNLVPNDTSSLTFAVGGQNGTSLPTQAPETGFVPGKVTTLPLQPQEKAYQAANGLALEIPALKLDLPILGVPLTDTGWDTTWLDRNAGWLNGTAFPGYAGNTVIVGHVYLADGLPGPMVDLEQLKWGDHITIRNGGQTLTYVVKSVAVVKPDDSRIMQHSDTPVLTLVTCKGYNDATKHYNWRVVVKATLLDVSAK
jgi:LPXTG-site transpeptidase (sortase) family protein